MELAPDSAPYIKAGFYLEQGKIEEGSHRLKK